MPKAIRIHQHGGPEVLRWEDVTLAPPGPGEARIRHTAIGLNFIDTYHRGGLYPLPLPMTLGGEAAGVVEAIGPGVSEVALGDRVGYSSAPVGAYCEQRLIPAARLVKLPASLTDKQAAAVLLKGMTSWYLVRRTYPIQRGDTVLVHAAAGGVGLILCAWAKHLGAQVIGTVGSAEKASLARQHGCDHVILYRETDFPTEVKKITGGKGLPVVYDGVGKDTFAGSLDCLRPRGLMISFGNASGAVPPFAIGTLASKGSLFLTRPTLVHYVTERAELETAARELFDVIAQGIVKIEINQTYALKDAAQAHRDLEARKTTGSTVLIP